MFSPAQHNDVRALQEALLKVRDDAVNTDRDAKGKTALMVAAESGSVATVVLLLLRGADCKATDRDDQTAQTGASACGCFVTSAVLDTWAQEAERTDLAYRSTVPELIAANRQKLVDKLCELAVEGDAPRIVGLLPRLLANGGPEMYLDAADKYGVTALYAASRGNHVDAIHALVGAGCTLDTVDDGYGWSALMGAAAEGAVEAVDALAKHGAELWLADRFHNTALDIAREGKHKSVVKALIKLRQSIG